MELVNLLMNTVNLAAILYLAFKYINKTDKNTDEIYKFKYNYLDRFEDVNTKIGKVETQIANVTGEIKSEIATLLERTKNQ